MVLRGTENLKAIPAPNQAEPRRDTGLGVRRQLLSSADEVSTARLWISPSPSRISGWPSLLYIPIDQATASVVLVIILTSSPGPGSPHFIWEISWPTGLFCGWLTSSVAGWFC